MLNKKDIIKKIEYLLAKYNQLMIFEQIKIKNTDIIDIQIFLKFNKNNLIIVKKNKTLYEIKDSYGLFMCIIFIIREHQKKNNISKKIVMVGDFIFDLSSVNLYN